MELIDKYEFVGTSLDENSATFVVHVTALNNPKLAIYPSQALLLAALQKDKAPTKIPTKFADYANFFSPDLAMELPKTISMNERAIELVESK